MGMGALAPQQGLSALQSVLCGGARCGGGLGGALAQVAASPFVWERFLAGGGRDAPFFSEFATADERAGGGAVRPGASAGARGAAAATQLEVAERRAFLASQVAATVRGLLGADVGADEPLMEAGLDSLGAVELKNALERTVGAELPATVMFDYPSVGALVGYLQSQLALAPAEESATPTQAAPQLSEAGGAASAQLIRVVAMAGRSTLAACGGVVVMQDTSVPVPHARWDRDEHSSMLAECAPGFSSFITAVDMFDAHSLSVPEAEAVVMDPQQRLLLEVASELWQSASSSSRSTRGEAGVYVGVAGLDYTALVHAHIGGLRARAGMTVTT
jgi:acyl carrier protein